MGSWEPREADASCRGSGHELNIARAKEEMSLQGRAGWRSLMTFDKSGLGKGSLSDCSHSLCVPQNTVYRKGKTRRELETGNSFNEI